jgi:hypothetical protein
VGLLGGAVVIFLTVYGVNKYKQRRRGHRLIEDDSGLESPRTTRAAQNTEAPRNASRPANDVIQLTRRPSATLPSLPNLNNNRQPSPLPSASSESRVPSAAAMSVTMLDVLTPAHKQSTLKSVPTVELITLE